ncbi:lactonase family protein [Rhodohalobacter sulfatireducens]|uniref:Lactonase family protein n=1 Tax=Rhodohalobacter sulfatireducens TaxID=2911366 RepID=A0ABS9K8E5_9BACT|nr:lactonase family protein [Rhodohalobacter sulfatireducens]MCG2587130.1 lactonase family protein [Rhodohalobacter sulfatireducens]
MKFLLSLSLLAASLLFITGCNQVNGNQPETNNDYYLFVGTYTGEGSEGIYLYKFNAEDGTSTPVDTVSSSNPSYLALSPDHSFLYAVNEEADSADASVSAFSFDKENGEISFLNKQSSRGGAPCYVSTDQTGNAVFVGNYLGGSLAAFPIRDDGSLAESTSAIVHEGSSVNERRQNSPHVHCTIISPDNNMLFVTDLGTDTVTGYAFDSESMTLQNEPSIVFETEPGAGPRHLTFHPNGEYAYLVNELSGTVVTFSYDGESLEELQTISTLPENYEGRFSGADIHVSADGSFLYASNREDLNNIVIYSIDQDSGLLEKVGEQSSGGAHPRNFMIDPTGNYLLVANRNTDNIVVFERDRESGLITPADIEINVSQPVSLQMVPDNE